jgi:hypothetical protein
VYVREPNAKERISGAVPLTQFGAMCARLQIRIIAASSAQAKAYASHCTSSVRAVTTWVGGNRLEYRTP